MKVPAKMRIAPLLMVTVPVKDAPDTAPVTRSVAAIVIVSGLPEASPAGVTVQEPVMANVYTAPP